MPAIKYTPLSKFLKAICISTCVFACHLFFIAGKTNSNIENIRLSQQRAVEFLKHIQRNDGRICDTINPLFETWETILAVTAIYKSNPDTNVAAVKNGLTFLVNNENSEGLICHNQKCKKAYCLETTAVYFNLLQLTGNGEKIIAGLKKVAALQKQNGEWDIGNPDVTIQKDFPSVTGFVLDILQSAGVDAAYKKEAINWLLQKQTKQGDWGSAWEYYGCPAYALWPVLKAIQNENTSEARLAKEKAIAYILASQNKNGSWFYKDNSFQKQTSPELQTALMLSALQSAGLKSDEIILKGIDFLVNNQQKNGSWAGGYFPIPENRYTKKEYVFATALAVDVMNNYLLNSNNK